MNLLMYKMDPKKNFKSHLSVFVFLIILSGLELALVKERKTLWIPLVWSLITLLIAYKARNLSETKEIERAYLLGSFCPSILQVILIWPLYFCFYPRMFNLHLTLMANIPFFLVPLLVYLHRKHRLKLNKLPN